MKKIFFIISLLFTFPLFSQTGERVEIEGKINVPFDGEAEGITVYNLNTLEGTITDEYGAFSIRVALNDSLSFSALQYEPFTVIVDQGVIDSKSLTITVQKAVTELEEVIVRPYDLSGNVRVDVEKVEVVEPNLQRNSAAIVNNPTGEKIPDVENIAMSTPSYLQNGIKFVNIFKEIFLNNDREKIKRRATSEPIDVQVRKMYNDQFFQKYIDIKKENINDFIFYAQRNGLTNTMLQKGNELDLIEFLIAQGEAFKKNKEQR